MVREYQLFGWSLLLAAIFGQGEHSLRHIASFSLHRSYRLLFMRSIRFSGKQICFIWVNNGKPNVLRYYWCSISSEGS